FFYSDFPVGVRGITLLMLRTGLGILFILHGYPKLNHLQKWSNALKMPNYLCFLSALSMLLGGFCLIAGFLTPLACLALLGSMAFALVLEISQGLPLVALDPYLIPQGEYEGANGKGEPPSQEKAFIFNLMLIVLLVFGAGGFSVDAWLVVFFNK
ncbi:MAG: DoxX family protein, partial [Cyanobacteria bacterium P01_A01_bin.40]